MASWQYDLTLASTRPVDVDALAARISGILPSVRSWSKALQTWGKMDGDRIDLIVTPGGPELLVRFDLRYQCRQFLQAVLSLAKMNDFTLKNDNDETIPSTVEGLAADMQRSDAFRFVSDPKSYLENLEESGDSP